jgi:hypothetical protein
VLRGGILQLHGSLLVSVFTISQAVFTLFLELKVIWL